MSRRVFLKGIIQLSIEKKESQDISDIFDNVELDIVDKHQTFGEADVSITSFNILDGDSTSAVVDCEVNVHITADEGVDINAALRDKSNWKINGHCSINSIELEIIDSKQFLS